MRLINKFVSTLFWCLIVKKCDLFPLLTTGSNLLFKNQLGRFRVLTSLTVSGTAGPRKRIIRTRRQYNLELNQGQNQVTRKVNVQRRVFWSLIIIGIENVRYWEHSLKAVHFHHHDRPLSTQLLVRKGHNRDDGDYWVRIYPKILSKWTNIEF